MLNGLFQGQVSTPRDRWNLTHRLGESISLNENCELFTGVGMNVIPTIHLPLLGFTHDH